MFTKENEIITPKFQDYVKNIYAGAGWENKAERAFPVKKLSVQIFDKKPPACSDTFMKSMYLEPASTYIDTVVLYNADMQLLQILDNRASNASATFQRSVSKGFTFSMSQAVAAGIKFETNFIFAKAEISLSVTLTFSEAWTKTVTETISCTVGPKDIAYFYQGAIQAAIMRYDAEKLKFYYLDNRHTGQYQTNILKTTSNPITF